MSYIEEFDPITGYRTDDPSAPRYIPGKLYPRNHRKLWDQNFDPVTDLRTDASSPANMTPDQLDPLEAASSPLAVEPSVGGADQAAIRMLMAKGMSYQRAAARVADEKAVASEEFQARIDAAAAASRNVPAPVAPEEPTVSPETIREYGYMSQAEPGPRTVVGGGKPVVGKQFNKMSEAIDYMTRPPVMDANRHLANPGAAYLESPRDRDMRLRGFFPVFADDGSVSYSVGTGQNALYPQDKGIPGGLGRLGPRKDLQETDPSQPGFILDAVDGPTGRNYIYKQNAAARDQQAAYMTERQLYRMAEAAGMSPAEFAAQNEGAFGAIAKDPEAKARMMVQGKRQADEAERLALWKSQMMLAGGRPTGGIGGSKAAAVAYNQLNDPNANNWQRAVMAKALVPGMDNTTPLTVDAMGAQNAMRFVNNRNFGANAPDPRVIAATLADLDNKRREGNPVGAGREDLKAGDLTSPMSMKEADRLAEQYDSGDEGVWWLGGLGGMSDQDEANLAAALTRDYGMDKTLAREAARRAADRQRWFRKRGPLAPAAPDAAAPPPAQGSAPPAQAVAPVGPPSSDPVWQYLFPGDF
jgi:hypothetical protein